MNASFLPEFVDRLLNTNIEFGGQSLTRAYFYKHIPIYCPKKHSIHQKYVIKQEPER